MTIISESLEITASPDAVFDVVSDLAGMGRFSPENTGGVWLKGSTPGAVGAKFRGTNAQGSKKWSTLATVVASNRATEFRFRVTAMGFGVATWSYELTPTATGTLVTETWEDNRSAFFKPISGMILRAREEFTRTSIHQTLNRMKQLLEASTLS